MTDINLPALRAATEDDVLNALDRAYIELPITTAADALELFNVMLDELTGEADRAEAEDRAKIEKASRGKLK